MSEKIEKSCDKGIENILDEYKNEDIGKKKAVSEVKDMIGAYLFGSVLEARNHKEASEEG